MADTDRLLQSLLFPQLTDPPASQARSVHRLAEGFYHIDDHDQYVYVVTVERVRKTRLLHDPVKIAKVDGVAIELVEVSLAIGVEVVLDAERGPAHAAALRSFQASYEQWEQSGDVDRPPPQWPADRLNDMILVIDDNLGTDYRYAWGQSGGTGTEWRREAMFLPAPPPGADRLTLSFSSPGGSVIHLALPAENEASSRP